MADPIDLDAPVTEVTLLEDRAHVLRRGSAQLSAGRSTLRIVGVAPVLADKTLAVGVATGAAGSTVDDARVRRRWKPPAERTDDVAKLEGELRDLGAERKRRAEDLERLGRRLGQQEELIGLTLEEMAEDVAWSRTPASEWRRDLDGLTADGRARRDTHLEGRFALEDLDERLAALEARLAQLRGGDPAKEATVEIDVTVPQAGAYELRCEYVVPGACWRPYHVATLDESGAEPQVRWSTQACTWQHSGEDWTDVQLRFSTERLSLGAEPPQLGTDTLDLQRRAETLEVEAREQQVHTAGLGKDESIAHPELPGVDDGGTTCTLKSATPATVPSDGRPYRVPLLAFTVAAQVSRIATPELAAAVLWKSTQANGAAEPILAGPVDLVRRHGLVGRTSVLYVAAGAKFDLGWGPDTEVRVRREQHEHPAKKGMLSSWTAREQHVTVRFSNLAPEAKQLELKERVPVSEIEKVEIETHPKKTTDARTPDADGFVTWQVELPAFGTKELELLYTVKTHKDVVWG